jgi:UV DNA damage endonuclease
MSLVIMIESIGGENMRHLGYVCINESLKPENFRNLRLNSIKTKGIEYLEEVVLHNVKHLNRIIDWNIENEIYFYRMPSFLIPFATHPLVVNDIGWHFSQMPEVIEIFSKVKTKVREHNLRISAHPDQFTVLNSPKIDVVQRSNDYLEYHGQLMNQVGGKDIVLHVGGVYGDRKKAKERFIENFKRLSLLVQKKLRIENDDTSYNLADVLEVAEKINVPVIFDYHHHRCLESPGFETKALINRVKATWENEIPKCHISSGENNIRDKKHADYIALEDFRALESLMDQSPYDLMIEARMKEQALMNLREKINNDS